MTTIAIRPLNAPAFRVAPASALRLPRPDLAQHAALAGSATSTALRAALAAVPFGALAWLFIAF